VTITTIWSRTNNKLRCSLYNYTLCATTQIVGSLLTAGSVFWQQLFKKMAQSGAPAARASLESGAFTFHYIIDNDVCYLKSYPKKLAYQYLEELQREFLSLYGREIEQAKRPYAFIKFGEDYFNLCCDLSQPPFAIRHASQTCKCFILCQ